MAKKKQITYKGVVIEEFKVGYPDGVVTYHVGSTFETTNEDSLKHLINNKKLK